MCKYKNLTKPNHWRIMLWLENKKQLLEICEKGHKTFQQFAKDRFSVSELSKELNMDKADIRKYLKELESLGYVTTTKYKGQIEVLL